MCVYDVITLRVSEQEEEEDDVILSGESVSVHIWCM